MNYFLTKLFNSNWFFITLVAFAIVLPLSQALVSIFAGIVLITSLVEDSWENKKKRLNKRKILFLLPAIFLIYLIGSIITNAIWGDYLYDLRKTLFFLVLPLAFIFGKEINNRQKRFIFYVFAFSIAISIIVALFQWKYIHETDNFNVHKAGLISHIRFSFQLILIIWFFVFLIQKNYKILKNSAKLGVVFLTIFYLSFLLFQQSLTGLIAFSASFAFYLFYLIFQLKKKFRIFLILSSLLIMTLPIIYVVSVVNSFYNIETFDKETIIKKTKQGNWYSHDFRSPMVENGNYVNLFICHVEMREEWNKLSEFKYDSTGINGYPVHSTLIRYLTSKDLKKDAKGVLALNKQDIQNIENGIANVIFQKKKYSLYPRIYQTVWEYYVYSHTGEANYQSFSQRIEFAKAALLIIDDNFWFGVGPGNWKQEFKSAYLKNKSKLNENLYASSHNQYLNYMVKFGIVGFTLIMFFIIYPIIRQRKYKDPLFLIFLVFLFFANFADSNFESHMGSSFFVFFYCLFLITGKGNYLTIKKNKTNN